MKRAALLVLVACSSRSSAPPSQGSGSASPKPMRPPLPPPPTMKMTKPIDLADGRIKELQLIPTVALGNPRKGEFDIRWRSPKLIDTGVVCRVETYNLAFFSHPDLDESLDRGQHSVFWHPDPFVLDPTVCEVRFVDAKHRTFASACYRAGNMTEGPCPSGTFPPPAMDPGQLLDIQGATVHAEDRSLEVKALYTVAKPVTDVSFEATCDGEKSARERVEDLIPLDKLHAGETLFAWELSLRFPKPLPKERPDQCELRAYARGKAIGAFCISEGSTERGPCARK